jgi:ABC-type amino acid transport substrate-binding protein
MALAAGAATGTAQGQTVRVTAGETVRAYGPVIEKLFAQAQMQARIEYLPNERALRQFISGESTAEFPRTRLAVAEIAEDVDFIGPISCSEVAVFAAVGAHPDLATFKGLAKSRVAAQVGNRVTLRLAADHGLSVEPVVGSEAMYRMLSAGRVDAVLDAEISGQSAIANLKLGDRLARLGPLLHMEPTYLVMRRRVPGLTARLDAAYQALNRSGEWVRLIGDINVAQGLPREFGLRCLQR